MSAGDFLILKNVSDTTALGTAGNNLDALWDNEVIDEGSAATYAAGTFTLTNTAPYLIMYSERFFTADVTNNARIEGQGRIRMNGVNLVEAACEGYIRKSSGQQTMVINGVGIYNATAGDTFTTRFYRGDTATAGTVNRVNGFGGVQIIELDASDNFARYSTTATNAMTSTESSLGSWSTDQQETGFTRPTAVQIATAGRYFMTFSGTTSQTGSSRLGATVFLERGTTEVTGVRGYSHMRGAEGNQNGALSFAGIIDVAANDQFTLRSDCDSGGMTLDAGAVWQFWQIPAGNETAIAEAVNGDMNATTDFAWDTLPHIDTSAFTGVAGSANITVDNGSHNLMFWNQSKKVIDGTQRAYPVGTPAVGGVAIDYAGSGVYHRNSGSIGAFATHGGATILPSVIGGSNIALKNSVLGAAGTIDVESGHFSLLNLEGLYKNYAYTFPIGVASVDGDQVVSNAQLNVVITGTEFEAVQGTGKVELVEFSNYTGTIVTQVNVDSWSDTSIQVDIIAGALLDTNCFLFVTNDSGGRGFISLQVGLPPETYTEAVFNMVPQPSHIWRFQNSYVDDVGTATANAQASAGTPTFSTTVICKGDTHSLLIDSETDSISPVNQADMNTNTEALRYIGGWIMLDRVSQTLSVIWEEGAQVNNMALLNGFGNNAMFQIADASEDYVQLYLDVSLTPNRPYHFLANFNANVHNSGVCRAYLDGVLQSRSDGNPWEQPELDAHSGSISWGHQNGESLKVGDDRGVDATTIAFVSPVNCNYAHWHNWTDDVLDEATDIRVTLFEKGALQEVTIASDTQVNMQAAIDVYSDTLFLDYPCSIEIGSATEGDFTLTLDNITFEDRVSIPIRYVGAGTVTLIMANGSDIDESKLSTPYGGTIIIQRPATLTFTGIVDGSTIFIRDTVTKDILGSTSSSVGNYILSVSVPSIDYLIMKLDYKFVQIINSAVSGDATIPILQAAEINYLNPI